MIKCYNNDLSEGRMSMNISDLLLKRKYLSFIKDRDDLTEGDFVDFFLSLLGKYRLASLLSMTNYMFYNNYNFMAILSSSVFIYMFNNRDNRKVIDRIIKDDHYNIVVSNRYTGKCISHLMECYELDYSEFVKYYIHRSQSHNEFLSDISTSLIEEEKTDLVYKYLLILFEEFACNFRYAYAYEYTNTFRLLKLLEYTWAHKHRRYSLELFRIYSKGNYLSLTYDYVYGLIDNIFYPESEEDNFARDKVDKEFLESLERLLTFIYINKRNYYETIEERVTLLQDNPLIDSLDYAINGKESKRYEFLRKTI